MKALISPAAMRDMEQRFFRETGMPSIDLMERAAQEVCAGMIERYGRHRRVLFACGPGGNGGDGYACARIYASLGGSCAVIAAAPPSSGDAIENRQRALDAGIPELVLDQIEDAPEIWVDALYGTGLSRGPSGLSAALIERMNADRARGSAVIAVDIPSGLNGTTGSAWRPCVRADVTFTFQYAKTGLLLGDGLDVCGAVSVLDIGIPGSFLPQDAAQQVEDGDVHGFLTPRARNIHKGSNGRLLIVAGSMGMSGAAALCAGAAMVSGAGLVTIAAPASIVPILQTLVPCAMCLPMPEREGALADEAAQALAEAARRADAVVCGCGLSTNAGCDALKPLLECGRPLLLDADALNLISANPALRRLLRPHHLITPHPGEAARLLNRAVTDPAEDAFALKTLNCQVLLKGATCVIPIRQLATLSTSGASGMAKGGSGDVLSGIIGALMASKAASGENMSGPALALCAAIGSELHGLAGEAAQRQKGVRGMTAQDIVRALPEVLMRYE